MTRSSHDLYVALPIKEIHRMPTQEIVDLIQWQLAILAETYTKANRDQIAKWPDLKISVDEYLSQTVEDLRCSIGLMVSELGRRA